MVFLFVLMREIVCWYFKLSELTLLLRQVRDRLDSIQSYGIGAEAQSRPAPLPTGTAMERGARWLRSLSR